MPPVTRRGYKNEFKHEVKSDPNPLEGHRPWCPHFPRGRDDLRVVRLNASDPNQLSTTAPLREPRHFTVFQSAAGGTTSALSVSVPAP
jgi:hypothetical protein